MVPELVGKLSNVIRDSFYFILPLCYSYCVCFWWLSTTVPDIPANPCYQSRKHGRKQKSSTFLSLSFSLPTPSCSLWVVEDRILHPVDFFLHGQYEIMCNAVRKMGLPRWLTLIRSCHGAEHIAIQHEIEGLLAREELSQRMVTIKEINRVC